jgi:hypothetical protein
VGKSGGISPEKRILQYTGSLDLNGTLVSSGLKGRSTSADTLQLWAIVFWDRYRIDFSRPAPMRYEIR